MPIEGKEGRYMVSSAPLPTFYRSLNAFWLRGFTGILRRRRRAVLCHRRSFSWATQKSRRCAETHSCKFDWHFQFGTFKPQIASSRYPHSLVGCSVSSDVENSFAFRDAKNHVTSSQRWPARELGFRRSSPVDPPPSKFEFANPIGPDA